MPDVFSQEQLLLATWVFARYMIAGEHDICRRRTYKLMANSFQAILLIDLGVYVKTLRTSYELYMSKTILIIGMLVVAEVQNMLDKMTYEQV